LRGSRGRPSRRITGANSVWLQYREPTQPALVWGARSGNDVPMQHRIAETSLTFWLPFPLSVNRLWRHDRGRVHLSPDYVRWKRKADEAARVQGLDRSPIFGRHTLTVELSARFKRRRGDVDNRIKCVLDWCERYGLDDGDCRRAIVEWADIDRDCLITLKRAISEGDYARLIVERSFRRQACIQ
jgi:Holliday junction resolvase RusA-like endonuclease